MQPVPLGLLLLCEELLLERPEVVLKFERSQIRLNNLLNQETVAFALNLFFTLNGGSLRIKRFLKFFISLGAPLFTTSFPRGVFNGPVRLGLFCEPLSFSLFSLPVLHLPKCCIVGLKRPFSALCHDQTFTVLSDIRSQLPASPNHLLPQLRKLLFLFLIGNLLLKPHQVGVFQNFENGLAHIGSPCLQGLLSAIGVEQLLHFRRNSLLGRFETERPTEGLVRN